MEYERGDILAFGKDSRTKEPILWIVIKQYEDKILLLSREALEMKPFHENEEMTTWENCTLRSWLNTEFFYLFFSGEEQKYIPNTKIMDDTDDNKKRYFIDKIFLLSCEEVYKYFPGCMENPDLLTARLEATLDGWRSIEGNCEWWLRTTRGKNVRASAVNCKGVMERQGYFMMYDAGVRPALWLDVNCETIKRQKHK